MDPGSRPRWRIAAFAGVLLALAAAVISPAVISAAGLALGPRLAAEPARAPGGERPALAPSSIGPARPGPLAEEAGWRVLVPGLAYKSLARGGATFHLVRVELERHELDMADARREGRRMAFVDALARESGALVAINGTFFDDRERPLGWVISGGRELNPLRPITWWAALTLRGGEERRADVLTTAQLRELAPEERAGVAFAVQVGPRTVAAGQPVRLKRQIAARSATCVRRDGTVLLLATEGAPVESNDLAALMAGRTAAGGLGCRDGLMLDGGPSTQLYVDAGGFHLHVRGGWGVPNAVVVRPRR